LHLCAARNEIDDLFCIAACCESLVNPGQLGIKFFGRYIRLVSCLLKNGCFLTIIMG